MGKSSGLPRVTEEDSQSPIEDFHEMSQVMKAKIPHYELTRETLLDIFSLRRTCLGEACGSIL